jgi:hypothetical protein
LIEDSHGTVESSEPCGLERGQCFDPHTITMFMVHQLTKQDGGRTSLLLLLLSLLGIFFDSEDGSGKFLSNTGLSLNCMALQTNRSLHNILILLLFQTSQFEL